MAGQCRSSVERARSGFGSWLHSKVGLLVNGASALPLTPALPCELCPVLADNFLRDGRGHGSQDYPHGDNMRCETVLKRTEASCVKNSRLLFVFAERV